MTLIKKLITAVLSISLFASSLALSQAATSRCDEDQFRDTIDCLLEGTGAPTIVPTTGDASITVDGETVVEFQDDPGRTASDDLAIFIRDVIMLIAGVLASLAGTFAVFMLLKSAGMLVTSQGDMGKMNKAKDGIVNALIGILIISFAYMIIFTVVVNVFRVSTELTTPSNSGTTTSQQTP